MAGKTRLSIKRRSKCTSILPVPLNSSKITSSMRLPVSIKAVAIIVKLPPSSIFLAAPKNLFRFVQRVGIDAAGENFAARRHDGIISARQARDAVEKNHDVFAMLNQPFGFFDHHFRHLNVPRRRFVKSRANHFAINRTLHVGDFFRPFIDEQNDQNDFLDDYAQSPWRYAATSSFYQCAALPQSNHVGLYRSEFSKSTIRVV